MNLKQALHGHAAVLLERNTTKAFLSDVLNNDEPKINALMNAYDVGVITTIQTQFPPKALGRSNMVSKLVSRFSMQENRARWAVDQWIAALDQAMIQEIAAARTQQEHARRQVRPPMENNTPVETIRAIKDKESKRIAVVEEPRIPAKGIDLASDRFPCGGAEQDHGFQILGVEKQEKCTHKLAPYFAVIFGMLQLRRKFEKSKAIENYEREHAHKALDLSRVYRLQMILLYMIRNNYMDADCCLPVSYDGDEEELKAALANINDLLKKLCLLTGAETSPALSVSGKGYAVSLDEKKKAAITVRNFETKQEFKPNLWFENNLIFRLDPEKESHAACMEALLLDFFKYPKFKGGQLAVLAAILNNTGHQVCIMPTGSGKSLIFYFAALLRSCPTFVVSPTEILIKDQLRNLRENHGIDNAAELTDGADFTVFLPFAKFIYLTPRTFLHRDLINRLIQLNYKQLIGNVVLDEVHCISNWSHDFRPEYLMLSRNLNAFVDKTGYLCFTATANYTVIRDIQSQLKIDASRVCCPGGLVNENIHFSFTPCKDDATLVESAAADYEGLIARNRILAFVKNQKTAERFYEKLNASAQDLTDRYEVGEPLSYGSFANEKVKGFVSNSEMGIGINLRSVDEVIHIGMPVSKSEFVQQIGRAARNNRSGISRVYFLDDKALRNEQILLQRMVTTEELLSHLHTGTASNDITDAYGLLFADTDEKSRFTQIVKELYEDLSHLSKPARIRIRIEEQSGVCYRVLTKSLYVIYRLGLIRSWYLVDSKNEEYKDFYVDPGTDGSDLRRAKEATVNYLNDMGLFHSAVRQIKAVTTVDALIEEYIRWYYDQFLYHHREQMLEMYEFLNHFTGKEDAQIYQSIRNYFSLALLRVEQDAGGIKEMPLRDINIFLTKDVEEGIADSVSRSMENEYSYKLDYFLFLYNAKYYHDINPSRLGRILSHADEAERLELLHDISRIYEAAEDRIRLLIMNAFCKYYPLYQVLENLYATLAYDKVYYTILMACFNKRWGNAPC